LWGEKHSLEGFLHPCLLPLRSSSASIPTMSQHGNPCAMFLRDKDTKVDFGEERKDKSTMPGTQ